MELFLFYAFTAILLSSAFMVIRVENAVHAVLYLVIVFCSHSALLLLLSVEFLALLLLVIYIGAIAILFLFVVMMITLKEKKQSTGSQDLPIGFFIGSLLFLVIFFVLHQEILTVYLPELETQYTFVNLQKAGNSKEIYGYLDLTYPTESEKINLIIRMTKDIENFGSLLYQNYFFNVLIAGAILLVALLGAVTLASEQGKKDQRRQQIYQQLSRQMKNAVLRIKS
jgi:NADH-quinone oxidoreductase subunit J